VAERRTQRVKAVDPATLAVAELYTIEGAALILQVSKATVERLIEKGTLGSVRIGCLRRISRAQLLNYVEKLEIGSGWKRPIWLKRSA
jgi:excisionase family DNA binding protein